MRRSGWSALVGEAGSEERLALVGVVRFAWDGQRTTQSDTERELQLQGALEAIQRA